jgi:hypothetical protein
LQIEFKWSKKVTSLGIETVAIEMDSGWRRPRLKLVSYFSTERVKQENGSQKPTREV